MNSRDVAEQFFDCYRKHDVEGMLKLFASGAKIDYVPIDATGTAGVQGRAIWAALIEAFPDLTNTVTAIYPNDDANNVTVEVTIGGRQAMDFLGIKNDGKAFSLKHVFIIETDVSGKITVMKAYWDNVKLFADLGKTTLT